MKEPSATIGQSVLSPQYVAGLFDGEGCIAFYRAGGWYHPAVSIGMVDREPLDMLMAQYGGTISAQKPGKLNRQVAYQWRVFGRVAAAFLTDITPYLIIKRAQAENVLPWLAVSGRNGHFRGPCIPLEEQEVIRARHYTLRASKGYRSVTV